VAVPALAALLTLIGLVNARRRARVRTVDIPIADLPPALHGFTIVQITDVHVGPTIKRGYVESIVDSVNALGADMIALTGDLVDGSVHHLAHHTEPFSRLAARHGLSSSRATTSTTPARTRGSRSCAASACACC
jgi:predicted MPP superfamily phosphohydrolase